MAALNNAGATKHLHERATELGFVGDKETRRYKNKPVAAPAAPDEGDQYAADAA